MIESLLQPWHPNILVRIWSGYVFSLVVAAWVYYVVRKCPPGYLRAVLSLPVVAMQLIITPLLTDYEYEAVLIIPVQGIFSLAAFKASSHGPLATYKLLLACCSHALFVSAGS